MAQLAVLAVLAPCTSVRLRLRLAQMI